jgi:probable rRNA maturation factor
MPREGAADGRLRVLVADGNGRRVSAPGVSRWLARIAPRRARGEVGVALVSNARVRTLNKKYRRRDYATDVLSFPNPQSPSPSPYLGDIVIATGVARRQARQAGHSPLTELRVLALHGLLHLLGYDHDDHRDRGAMARVERALRRKGGLREGLIERETPESGSRRSRAR